MMQNNPPASSPQDVLEWHLNIGVDETISDAPVNRFDQVKPSVAEQVQAKAAASASPNPSSSGATPVRTPARTPDRTPARTGSPGPSGEAAIKSAFEMAEAATTVAELREALENFDGCALKKTATNLVFMDGDPHARLMFVGEAPGAEEDRQGVPFIGPSGKLLDSMLASIGMARKDVMISNTVFWRPPGNRTPTPQETAVCMPFMERLIELVDPDILVTLGGPASKSLLGETQGVGRLRGRWFTFQSARMSHPVDATAMFHPAYLLRTPGQKRPTWGDLLAIKEKLGTQG